MNDKTSSTCLASPGGAASSRESSSFLIELANSNSLMFDLTELAKQVLFFVPQGELTELANANSLTLVPTELTYKNEDGKEKLQQVQ